MGKIKKVLLGLVVVGVVGAGALGTVYTVGLSEAMETCAREYGV